MTWTLGCKNPRLGRHDMKYLTSVFNGIVFLCFSLTTHAAFITIDEAALDAIYSQPSFGSMPIDIRVGPTTEIVAPSLLNITSNAEVNELFRMHVGPVTTVNFYFIDAISACGSSVNSRIIGCGETPGNDFVVESSFAAGRFGSELLGHELGHNLGLQHRTGGLMNPTLNGSTILLESEVETILRSRLVQTDGINRWINLMPVLVVEQATLVSAPATLLLLVIALLSLGFSHRKRVSCP